MSFGVRTYLKLLLVPRLLTRAACGMLGEQYPYRAAKIGYCFGPIMHKQHSGPGQPLVAILWGRCTLAIEIESTNV